MATTKPIRRRKRCAAAPLSPYAVSKYTAEYYGTVFSKTFGLETVRLRYFNVFGPRQHPESQYAAVIPKFMAWAVEERKTLDVHWDGKQSRDFTYIDNVVDANLLAASPIRASAARSLISPAEKAQSLLEIIRALEKLVRTAAAAETLPSARRRCAENLGRYFRARRFLRYVPQVDFHEGLRSHVGMVHADPE